MQARPSKRLAGFTVFLAVLMLLLAPGHAAFATCCCSGLAAPCCDMQPSDDHPAAPVSCCCKKSASSSPERGCCKVSSHHDNLAQHDGTIAGDHASGSCECDTCRCTLVSDRRPIATTNESVTPVSSWVAVPPVWTLAASPVVAIIRPVQTKFCLSSHDVCVRFCRWLN